MTIDQLREITDKVILIDDMKIEIEFGKLSIDLYNYSPYRTIRPDNGNYEEKSLSSRLDVNNYCSVKVSGMKPSIVKDYLIKDIRFMWFVEQSDKIYNINFNSGNRLFE
jgi:hypothetical protein